MKFEMNKMGMDMFDRNVRKMKTRYILTTVSFIIIVIVMTVISIPMQFNDHTYTEDSSSSKYIVFADDQNGNSLVFQNTDNILRGKVNSSNMQGQLKVGNTYEITVIGYRVPLLNMYENIIKMKEIK